MGFTVAKISIDIQTPQGPARLSLELPGELEWQVQTVPEPPDIDPPDPNPEPEPDLEGFFVAPAGEAGTEGTTDAPWSLHYALSGADGRVVPGTTLYLRGGTYPGHYKSQLTGTQEARITVRAYPGEQPRIDCGQDNPESNSALEVLGSWTDYIGLELTDSRTSRTDTGAPSTPDGILPLSGAADNRFIYCLMHDLSGQAIGSYLGDYSGDYYGNVCWYNGLNSLDHNIYTQNEGKYKTYIGNVIAFAANHGFHAYGSENSRLDKFLVTDNVSIENGLLRESAARNFLVGGGDIAEGLVFTGNHGFYSVNDGTCADLGYIYGLGTSSAHVLNNHFIGGFVTLNMPGHENCHFTGNELYPATADRLQNFDPAEFPENTYHESRPTGLHTYVIPIDRFQPGRALIVVYNWDEESECEVDLAGLLEEGAPFEVRSTEDFLGSPVLPETEYDGSPLRLPLAAGSVQAPTYANHTKPNSTLPVFGCFVVVPKE